MAKTSSTKAAASKPTRALPPARTGASTRAGMNIEEDEPGTSLAVRDEGEMNPPAGGQEFTDNPIFGRGDLMMPNLKLAQGLTPEVVNGEAVAGQWLLLGQDPEEEVVVIPMQYGAGRALQEKDDFAVLCSSKDRVKGEGTHGPGSRGNKTGLCAQCPMAEWGEKNQKTGKSTPPQCGEYYTYAVFSVTHGAMALMTFRKTALNAAKQLNTIIMQKKLGGFAVKFGHTQKTSGNRTWQVPTLTIATGVEPSQFEMARAMFGR